MNKSKKMSTTMKVVPASILSVIIIAALALLGMLDFDFGFPQGLSEGESAGEAESGAERMVSTADVTAQTAESPQQDGSVVDPIQPSDLSNSGVMVQPTEVIDVVIDGDTYLVDTVRQGGVPIREPLTLSEVVGLAELMSGDSSGVKVRISRTFDATAQADTALLNQLKDAGLSEDEIDRRRTLVKLE